MKVRLRESLPLLEALRRFVPGASNRTLRRMLSGSRVRVNGKTCKLAKRVLSKGDLLELAKSAPRSGRFRGIHILFEDDSILVIHKPAGLLTVSTPHEKERTVFAYLREYVRKGRPGSALYVVHRLDKYVSGVMVFAKSSSAKEQLQSLFRRHEIDRRYWAIVEGRLHQEQGTIDTYLSEDGIGRVRSTKDPGKKGKRAVTHYRVRRRLQAATTLEVTLETGRKNQIRAHLSAMGYPILGDRAYGSRQDPFGRIGLHAYVLGFRHPTDRKTVRFSAPPPPEFRRYLPARAEGQPPRPTRERS